METGIQDFGIWNLELTAQGIRNNDNVYKQNPNSTDKKSEVPGIRNPQLGIQNP